MNFVYVGLVTHRSRENCANTRQGNGNKTNDVFLTETRLVVGDLFWCLPFTQSSILNIALKSQLSILRQAATLWRYDERHIPV